ncbi:MAG: hypothetical protein WC454_10585 [Phycisphaerae bacterium]|jgi:hypothetical protein
MRRLKSILWLSLILTSLIALFWAVWHFIFGGVPIVTNVMFQREWTYALPFGISRGWDILIGPIWSTCIIIIFTSKNVKKGDLRFNAIFTLCYALISVVTIGELSLIEDNLAKGLDICLAISLVSGLGFSLAYGFFLGLRAGLVTSLVASLIAGLCFGLIFGMIVGMFFSLCAVLGAGLRSSFKLLLRTDIPRIFQS